MVTPTGLTGVAGNGVGGTGAFLVGGGFVGGGLMDALCGGAGLGAGGFVGGGSGRGVAGRAGRAMPPFAPLIAKLRLGSYNLCVTERRQSMTKSALGLYNFR